MARVFTLIFGEPGIGKSTAVKMALDGTIKVTDKLLPVKHVVYKSPRTGHYGAQIGRSTSPFPGTDGLGYSAAKQVLDWLSWCPYDNVIAEGDRLANMPFIQEVMADRFVFQAVHLYAPEPEFAEERRFNRSHLTGKLQNESWVRGRRSKAFNLAKTLRDKVLWIDVTQLDAAEELRKQVAFRSLL